LAMHGHKKKALRGGPLTSGYYAFSRLKPARTARPSPSRPSVAGTGTADCAALTVALKKFGFGVLQTEKHWVDPVNETSPPRLVRGARKLRLVKSPKPVLVANKLDAVPVALL